MKAIKYNLLSSVGGTYLNTRTTTQGRITQKTISGKNVLGPNENKFIDVFTINALTPTFLYASDGGRVYATIAVAAGVFSVMCFDFDYTTFAYTYRGRVIFTVINAPATTHTIRGFQVDDTNTNEIFIFVATTGSVTANGGLYMAYKVPLTAFTPVGTTLPTATAANQINGVYKLENSPFTLTQSVGLVMETDTKKIRLQNGVSATYQFARFDYSSTPPLPGANGIITSFFDFITGNLPAASGTLLLTNCTGLANPTTGPNAGQKCAFFLTGTNVYEGRLSDLTNGATTWTSLRSVNTQGAVSTIVQPTVTHGIWSDILQRIVLVGNGQFFIKQFVDSSFESIIGATSNQFLEGIANPTVGLGHVAVGQIDIRQGVLFASSSSAGQRGIICHDIRSNEAFDFSYIVSKVLDTPLASYVATSLERILKGVGNNAKLQYRTSGFGSISGGWIDIPDDFNMTSLAYGAQVQFKISFYNNKNSSAVYAQISEGYLILQGQNEISDNWVFSHPNTQSNSPAYSAFRLVKSYPVLPTALEFQARDDAGTLVASARTDVNPERFDTSTNNGTSWIAFAGIPNTALLSEIRYKWISPPGSKVTVSLREVS